MITSWQIATFDLSEEDTMFKYIKSIIVIIGLGLVFGLTAFVAPAANAEEPTPPTPVVNITISAAAEAELEVDTVTTLDTDASGKVMMRPLQDHQLTDRDRQARAIHWLWSDAQKCPTVANQPTTQAGIKAIRKTSFIRKGAALNRFKRAVPSAKITKRFPDGRQKLTVRCFLVKVDGTFTDTGVDPNGKKRGMKNTVGGPGTLKRPMLFDTAVMNVRVNGQVVQQEVPRRRGQNVPGSKVVGYGDCLNPKADTVDLLPGGYVYAWSWSAFRQRVQGDLNQRLHVAGRGRVERGGCYVEYEYDFLTEGSLAFDQTLWAKTKAEAKGKAGSAVVDTDISSNTNVTGSIKNTLEANLRVAFGEQCDGPPPSDEAPSLDANAAVCTTPGGVDDEITASGTNNDSVTRTLVFNLSGGPTSKPNIVRTVGAGSTATVKWTGLAPGNYVVTVTANETDLSDSEAETLAPCPPPADNPPEMTCTGMEHIYVGEDRSAFDFDASDVDGNPISFGEPVVSGPLNVVTVERSTWNGKQRLTVWVTAKQIPEGTSQAASVKVIATANGKSVPCTVNTTVVNENTGW